jgi:hypothetical protein
MTEINKEHNSSSLFWLQDAAAIVRLATSTHARTTRRLSENSIRGQGLFENDHQISSDYFMKSDYLPQILFWLLITDFVLQKTAA